MRRCLAVLLLVLAAAPVRAEERDLKRFFAARCAVCHGPDGTGRGVGGIRLGARGFGETRALVKVPDADLARAIREGAGAMPAFRTQLTEAEARRMVVEVIRPMVLRKHR